MTIPLTSLKPGMTFNVGTERWRLVSCPSRCKVKGMDMDNRRRNKWYAEPVDYKRPDPMLLCFDVEIENDAYNFRD